MIFEADTRPSLQSSKQAAENGQPGRIDDFCHVTLENIREALKKHVPKLIYSRCFDSTIYGISDMFMTR